MTGTLINVATVLAGSSLGLLIGARMPDRVRETVMNGIGLFTVVLGCRMGLASALPLVVLGSVALGGIAGEMLNIEGWLNRQAVRLDKRRGIGGADSNKVANGFVTASLLFCAGPLTVVGCILDGASGNAEPLLLKSVLDGFTSLALSASLGIGVVYSAATVLIYQGGLTIIAMVLANRIGGLSETTSEIVEMGATGGVVIVAIGIVILDLKSIRVANFLPALFLAPLLTWLWKLV